MCGEHLRFNGIRCLGKGSSPRVRGTRLWWFSCSVLLGIIPACAGNTNRLAVRRPAWRDHPRVCGEHALLMILSTGSAGSSPRVRGTRTHETYSRWEVGIIPACAGNTKRTRPWPAEAGIIPACAGNTGSSLVRWVRSSGSSPRVRGTLERLEAFARAVGIIPACAGNTAHMICLELPTRDHPRVCGEHDHIGHGGIRVKGSSPRVRGTPGRRVCAQAMRGIIPACAGNTLRPSHASSMHGDHPRVCGEHSGEGGEPEPKSGSSPRVRGTLRDGLGSCLHAGIIPACAGNTAYVLSAFSSSRDHPRVCGEHELPELRQAAIRGSSPRVRGTPPAQPIRLLLAGIIPACAGNTP